MMSFDEIPVPARRASDKIRQAQRLLGTSVALRWEEVGAKQDDPRIAQTADVIPLLASADPTSAGTYVMWLVRQWLVDRYRVEDLPRLRNYLDLFDRKRSSIAEKDINRYPSPQALLTAVKRFMVGRNGRVEREYMRHLPHARVLQDDATCLVVEPLTRHAAAYWGHDTEWCIAWGIPGSRYPDRRNRFSSYRANGRFLFVLDRARGAQFALHLSPSEGFSLWDSQDEQQDVALVLELPGLHGDAAAMVEEAFPLARLRTLPPDAHKRLLTVLRDGRAVQDVPNPNPEERMWAAFQNAAALDYIDCPTPSERLAILQRNGRALLHFLDTTPEERMTALQQDGTTLGLIPNPTPEERMTALRQNGYAIIFLRKNATPEERMTALKQNPFAIGSLHEPTPEERMTAVRQAGMAIGKIAHPMPEERMTAILQEPFAIRLLEDPTPEERMAALKQNGRVIPYVKNPTSDERMTAVRQDCTALYLIENPTPEERRAVHDFRPTGFRSAPSP